MFIKNVTLSPLHSTHKEFLLKAYNQQAVIETGFITYDYPMSDVRLENIIDNWLKDSDYYKCFIIEKNNESIGVGQITNINYINRTCEIGVFFVEEHQGKGAALSAALQLLEIVFNHMDFYKVLLRVQDINPVLMRGAEKIGFYREGTLREHVKTKAGRCDLHYYGQTQKEYSNLDINSYKKYITK